MAALKSDGGETYFMMLEKRFYPLNSIESNYSIARNRIGSPARLCARICARIDVVLAQKLP